MIRVAMIIQAYLPHVGGAEAQLASLIPLLRENGIDPFVITRRYSDWSKYEIIDSTPIYRMPIPLTKSIASISFTLNALRVIHRMKPDLIHAYDMLSPATTALFAKYIHKTPIIVKVLRGGKEGDLYTLKMNPLGAFRSRLQARSVNAFITISHEIDQELRNSGVSIAQRHYIPNGVDTARFSPATDTEKIAIRKELGIENKPTTIFTGRLTKVKCIDSLILSWKFVRDKIPDATLIILGSGPEEQVLQEMAGEGILFRGKTTNVSQYLRASDVFVLPSSTEGLSNAMLEAMSCGLPVVVSQVGGSIDAIDHSENGWLIPPNDPVALQSALIRVLEDPDLQSQLGHAARERILEDFSLSLTADRLTRLYTVLGNGRQS
jgi:glycosyltransferase involved in cell wall biosynthesis